MSDLLTLAREFDLPPKWNDCLVEWEGWKPQPVAHLCPPPRRRDCCSGCGSPELPVVNRGYAATSALVTPAMLRRNKAARDRLGPGSLHHVPSVVLLRLYAYRCQDCRHDVVWDIDTDEWWDLDHTDYGPEGSR